MSPLSPVHFSPNHPWFPHGDPTHSTRPHNLRSSSTLPLWPCPTRLGLIVIQLSNVDSQRRQALKQFSQIGI